MVNYLRKLRRTLEDKGVYYWLAILIFYGILLASFKTYTQLSLFYHVLMLAFPLFLIYLNRKFIEKMKIEKGKVKEGLKWVGLVTLVAVLGIYLRAYLMGKPVQLVREVSLLALFNLGILAPIAEELMHRGYLQSEFMEKLGENKGLILASVFFALIHVPKMLIVPEKLAFSAMPGFMKNPLYMLFSFGLLGYLFGMVYNDTESIYYPMTVHAILNFLLYFLRY